MSNMIEVTDFSSPELDVFARLTEAQLRNRLEPEKGIFVAESPKVIERALNAGYEPVSLLMERKLVDLVLYSKPYRIFLQTLRADKFLAHCSSCL